jgi:hypothetical protein
MAHVVGVAMLVLGLLAVPGQARAAVDPDEINKAIGKGMDALRAMQRGDGTWSHMYHIGATGLAGLTLLECGAGPDDRAVKAAAKAVREGSLRLNNTYSLALGILFLDRLDDAADTPLIESMTIRLLAGQADDGGWTYTCPEVNAEESRALTARMRGAELRAGRAGAGKLPAKGRRTEAHLSREAKDALARLTKGFYPAPWTDNSNTQFATLALWVGRRYGVPVDKALKRVEQRFRSTQRRDGGWAYASGEEGRVRGPVGVSTATMTCAGLLGVAIGHGVRAGEARTRNPKAGKRNIGKDRALINGLKALAGAVGKPAGEGRRRKRNTETPTAGGRAYYFLWSLERVAVALDLKTIGKKDWYAWGAEVLLANQRPDGSWVGEYGGSGADTCFALLFLKRANLARDLTGSIAGLSDPGGRVLKAGGVAAKGLKGGADKGIEAPDIGAKAAAVAKAPARQKPEPEPRNEPKPDPEPKPEPKSPWPSFPSVAKKPAPGSERPTPHRARGGLGGVLTPPAKSRAAEQTAAVLQRLLVRGSGPAREAALRELEKRKGTEYTEALAGAIPRLREPTKNKAREALAGRLARMKTKTLESYLEDDDAEIRRAAALACAAKDDQEFVPDLIALLNDRQQSVERAAYTALKALTGKDFGPPAGATGAERDRAIAAWKKWWKEQGRE